jgi:hypothetical protein
MTVVVLNIILDNKCPKLVLSYSLDTIVIQPFFVVLRENWESGRDQTTDLEGLQTNLIQRTVRSCPE